MMNQCTNSRAIMKITKIGCHDCTKQTGSQADNARRERIDHKLDAIIDDCGKA